jgi:hypothetical protein
MKQSAIAAVIERDLLRSNDSPLITTVQCFSCGHGMTTANQDFVVTVAVNGSTPAVQLIIQPAPSTVFARAMK